MGSVFGLLWLFTGFLQGAHGQGVYGKHVTSPVCVCVCVSEQGEHGVNTSLTRDTPHTHLTL